MKRKHWLIGLGAVLLLALSVKGIMFYRWSHLSSAEKAGTITDKMARHFHLSEAQKGKVYALNLEKIQAFESARQSGRHSRADWKKLHESWRTDLRAVLTPEQQQKFRH